LSGLAGILVYAISERRVRDSSAHQKGDALPADYLDIEDDQNRRNAAALVAANFGVFEFEPKSARAFWDARVRELWGAGPDDVIDYAFVISQVHTDDLDYHNRSTEQALDPTGSGEMDIEYRLIAREDQEETWIRAKAKTLFEKGEAVRLVGTVEDITTRKRAQLRNEILLRELQHRLKNALAIVGSLVQLSKPNYSSVDAFSEALTGRIQALSHAQDMLQSNEWQDVWLSDICEAQIASVIGKTDRVTTQWTHDILIPEQYVLTSTIAIFELATNAVKYGALSGAAGSISISASKQGNETRFEWRETGGPALDAAAFATPGFGSTLLCTIWPAELGGTATYRAEPEGAVYDIVLRGGVPK
jgi:PAS domain S-box-containing protein